MGDNMGVLPKHLELLAIEDKNNSQFIKGSVLTLGQQYVFATLDDVLEIFKKHEIEVKQLPKDFNTKNKIPQNSEIPDEDSTNAQTVLTLLGADSVFAADISPYQNADFIFDLNKEIDPQYEQKFDIIFDVGTLEHIFDIPTALKNITRMLKPGGRVILILPASNAIDHGFYSFSPTFLYDFFSCNGFEGFSCYLLEGNPLNCLRKGKIWKYTGLGNEYPLISSKGVEIYFSATKQSVPKEFEIPIQSVYLNLMKNINSNCVNESESNKKKFLIKLRSKTWRFFPEFLETWMIKKYRKDNNLIYIGKY
jgi:SAM-dependent methyltransferase